MALVALPLTIAVTRPVRHHLPSVMSQITSLSCTHLNIVSMRIGSMFFPGTEERLTSLQLPESSFLPLLKIEAMFPFFSPQELGLTAMTFQM